jgi:hypothetical protein
MARAVAEDLAKLLGDPTDEPSFPHSCAWVAIHEARDDLGGAIRIEDAALARHRRDMKLRDYDKYPHALGEDVEHLQDSLYFQAERHIKLGQRNEAMVRLTEIYILADKYGVKPDEDVDALLEEVKATTGN